MSTKKENNKSNEYRTNKKINKAKIKSGQRSKNFLNNEESILNTLPSGAFDRVIANEKEEEYDKNTDTNKYIDTEKYIDKNINNNIFVEEEEYEEFDESYFNPQVYHK